VDRNSKCPYCGSDSAGCVEVDKENRVIVASDTRTSWVLGCGNATSDSYISYSGDKKFENRPWGSFLVLLDEPNVKVKKIVVKPEKRLSLQLHKDRKEDWVVVSGYGTMQIGDNKFDIGAGQHIHIGKYDVHRVQNGGSVDLVIIEIQTGECREDDIVRIEDDYGRLT
jgi:mannose-6-phosphate isomerase-like protein (cupin superfamily)